MVAVLVGLMVTPSLLLTPQMLPRCAAPLRFENALMADGVTTTIRAPPAPTEEEIGEISRAYAAADEATRASTITKLKRVTGFDANQGAAAFKEQLTGSWQCLAASDGEAGLSGFADKSYLKATGHTQTFKKPDPMDIFAQDKSKLYFMESTEVVANAKDGAVRFASIKGGFTINDALGVIESYTFREFAGAEQPDGLLFNRWSCNFLSDTLRVCKSDDGAIRVYEKLADEAAAKAHIATLLGETVDVDPEKVWAEDEVANDEPEDDPNDTRPAWQKRIDEADGIKRTANGTPINNFGPPPSSR